MQPAEVDSDPPRGSPNFLQPPSVASVVSMMLGNICANNDTCLQREVQSSSTGKRRRVCEETTLGMGGGSSSQVSERQGAMTADEWRTRLNNVAVKKSGTERITFRQLEEQGVFDPKLWQGITVCRFLSQHNAKKTQNCVGILGLYRSELAQNQ
jgi:hypothetical protein